MTLYKIEEKKPEINQYCFVSTNIGPVFAIYKENDVWGFFIRPSIIKVEEIKEWQPAIIQINKPSIDLHQKKVVYDLVDVVNDENVSMWKEFINSIEVSNDSATGNNNSPEGGRGDVSPQDSKLRADNSESAECTVGCIGRRGKKKLQSKS